MSNFSNKILIVDGYNILRSEAYKKFLDNETADWTDDLYNKARESLLNLLSQHIDYTVAIVYDAANRESHKKNSGFDKLKLGKINTIFTPTNISADSIIEKLAYEAIEENYKVSIATNDNVIRDTTSNKGIAHISASNLCLMLEEKTVYNQTFSNNGQSTIEYSIDKLTRKKLEKLKENLAF